MSNNNYNGGRGNRTENKATMKTSAPMKGSHGKVAVKDFGTKTAGKGAKGVKGC